MEEKHVFASIFVIVIFLFCGGNGYTVISEITNGKAKKFDKKMTERIHLLSCIENKNEVVYIEPIREKPLSLFVLDLSEDSTYWVNYCQAKYFDVKGIICK